MAMAGQAAGQPNPVTKKPGAWPGLKSFVSGGGGQARALLIQCAMKDSANSTTRAMPSECEYGVCGHCAKAVVSGVPEHYDSYLTEAERASNKIVMPCVSRCRGDRIELDI